MSRSILVHLRALGWKSAMRILGRARTPAHTLVIFMSSPRGKIEQEVEDELKTSHDLLVKYTAYVGELKLDKSYRFGQKLSLPVPAILEHKPELRLLGGACATTPYETQSLS